MVSEFAVFFFVIVRPCKQSTSVIYLQWQVVEQFSASSRPVREQWLAHALIRADEDGVGKGAGGTGREEADISIMFQGLQRLFRSWLATAALERFTACFCILLFLCAFLQKKTQTG